MKVTEELLYDNAFHLDTYIIEQFAQALANAEEDAFLNGDGEGKPLGIFADDGGAEVGVTAASDKAITADEVISLIYSLKRPYRKKAKFILNDQTISALRKLKDNNGQYIWQPSLQAGEPDRLLGYEVLTSQFAPQIEAGKPAIAFGDFSYYNIGDRGTRSFQELKELFAGNGMVSELAALGKSSEEVEKLSSAAVYLSNVTGKDLNSSMTTLLGTYNGTTTQLKKLGVDVSNLTKDELSQGAAIDVVIGKFGELSDAMAEASASQSLKNIKDTLGDIRQGFGQIVSTSIKPMLAAMWKRNSGNDAQDVSWANTTKAMLMLMPFIRWLMRLTFFIFALIMNMMIMLC